MSARTTIGVAFRALVVAAAVAAPILTWLALSEDRHARIEELTRSRANEVAVALERDLRLRLEDIERWARRWERVGAPSREEFDAEARSLMDDMPGFRALSWVDPDFVVRRVAPSGSRALGLNVAELGSGRRQALEAARDERRTTATPPIELAIDGGAGFLIVSPIHGQGEFEGALLTVLHAPSWARHVAFDGAPAPAERDFEFRARLDDATLFATEGFETSARAADAAAPEPLFGRVLGAELQETQRFVADHWSWRPEIMAAVAAVMGGLVVALLLYAARLDAARARSERAEETAQRAEAAMSRFLATVSHEVRTPLNAIMGLFELIARAEVPERQRRQAGNGLLAARRLSAQLTDVIDASHLDAGALSVQPETAATADLVEPWRASLEGRIARSGKPIEARVEVSEAAPPAVVVDARRATQIVENLIDNAVKFTPSGEVALIVRPAPGSGRDLLVEVRDTGPGIRRDRAGAIFERFYQIRDEGDRVAGGSGLGLAISRELAQRMGGSLTVASESGEGSSFTLRLSSDPTPDDPVDPAPAEGDAR